MLAAAGFLVYAVLEWWLPRTERVRAYSAIELIANAAKRIMLHRVPMLGEMIELFATRPEPLPAPSLVPAELPAPITAAQPEDEQ